MPATVKDEEEPSVSVVRVNWTMMAMRGDNWELLKDYESEGDGEDSPMSLLTSDEEQGDDERPSKGDFKVALKTVLKAPRYMMMKKLS